MPLRIVHASAGRRLREVWSPAFVDALRQRGELTLHEETAMLPDPAAADLIRPHDVAIVGWDARTLPRDLADDPGRVRYVCCYSGTIRSCVPRELVAAGLRVSNWGDLPASGVGEAAMTLLLAAVHDLGGLRRAQEAGQWGADAPTAGSLQDLAVGIYGMGVIGRRFVEMLRPFGARMMAYDPYVDELPDDVERAESLERLCGWAEALIVHAGQSDETIGSVTAARLAQLPDHGIVINTARGAIIDQEALFAELASGRLRAGLDVLEPDELAPDHPLRGRENVWFTFHQLSNDPWPERPDLTRLQRRVLEQIDRFAAGEVPQFLFDVDRYDLST